MVAPATTDDARDPVTIDHERVLWDAEYRREVIERLKRLEKAPQQGAAEQPARRRAA